MATDYGTKEKSGKDGNTVGQGFGGNEKMKSSKAKSGGESKAGKSSNHAEHDEMMHKMMPAGYKGDCGY